MNEEKWLLIEIQIPTNKLLRLISISISYSECLDRITGTRAAGSNIILLNMWEFEFIAWDNFSKTTTLDSSF
jgi:hypothetical protein